MKNFKFVITTREIKERKKMSFYSLCNNNQEFVPQTEHEKAFDCIIKRCMELGQNEGADLSDQECETLFKAYHDLCSDIRKGKTSKETLSYMCCSLFECMCMSKPGEISGLLCHYIFDHFLPQFIDNETIKKVIRKLLSLNVINSKSTVVCLKMVIEEGKFW